MVRDFFNFFFGPWAKSLGTSRGFVEAASYLSIRTFSWKQFLFSVIFPSILDIHREKIFFGQKPSAVLPMLQTKNPGEHFEE